jgi:hypothetical protein
MLGRLDSGTLTRDDLVLTGKWKWHVLWHKPGSGGVMAFFVSLVFSSDYAATWMRGCNGRRRGGGSGDYGALRLDSGCEVERTRCPCGR